MNKPCVFHDTQISGSKFSNEQQGFEITKYILNKKVKEIVFEWL